MLPSLRHIFCIMLLIAIAPISAHAAATVQPSGFLQDPSLLRKGNNGEPLWIYRHPEKSIGDYDQVVIDPIVVLHDQTDKPGNIDPSELKQLLRYFRYVGETALSDAYPVVSEPGPGVMRVRVAINTLTPSKPCLLSLSSLPGPIRAASMCKLITQGSYLFAGNAVIEAEIVDSLTGETVLALVDKKGDDHKFVGNNGKWSHVMHAFNEWAVLFRKRLDEAHARNTDSY